jgi:mono/diheme cytochrome c family protein
MRIAARIKDGWSRVIVGVVVVWAICTAFAVTSNAQAPAGSGIWGGVYTDAQAKRGLSTSGKVCASCHGVDLMGGEGGGPLAGAEFLGTWNQRSLGELFDCIQTTMPSDTLGSLSPQDSSDLIAFMLQVNKFPAGQKELPTDVNALNQIKIESQPPAK